MMRAAPGAATAIGQVRSDARPGGGRERERERERVIATLRILVVEDSRADAALVAALLEGGPLGDVEITRAERVEEARALVQQQSYDVLLVDLQLPDARGV